MKSLIHYSTSNKFLSRSLKGALLAIGCSMLHLTANAGIVSGYVIVENENHFFVDGFSPNTYEVMPSNPSVKGILDKLNSFDRIRGQANTTSDATLVLETIDFVTLRKVLGPWIDETKKVAVNFRDYKSLEFSRHGKVSVFTYTLSPGSGNSWKIFMSDPSKVTLGNLIVRDFPDKESELNLEILDSGTGAITETLYLKRKP